MTSEKILRLDGKIALVTGGYGGIGEVVCRGLAAVGARVAISGHDAGKAEACAASIGRDGSDAFDVRGRTAHESIFNVNDGHYRCANSQQGYSPFSTWTRGLAWAILGYSEQLELLAVVDSAELSRASRRSGGVI